MSSVSLFEDRLDRFGGDLGRWPADARAEADALLEHSTQARELLAAMTRLEVLLRARRDVALPSQVAAVAMRTRQLKASHRTTRRAAWSAAAAAALLVGVMLGSTRIDMHDDNPDQVMASALDGGGVGDVD